MMILSNVRGALRRIRSFITKKKLPYLTVYTNEMPDKLDKDTIYILGEGIYLWYAAMLCPCGCNEIVQVSLHKEGRPRWYLYRNCDNTVSLHPSIWRKKGCCSHFMFKNGYIEWYKSKEE